MPFQKGFVTNPGGRSTERVFANALRAAVNAEDPKLKRRKVQLIAEKLVECALLGEPWAVQQVADRLDGKPAQEATLTTITQVQNLSDDELTRIAASSSDGAAQKTNGSSKPH